MRRRLALALVAAAALLALSGAAGGAPTLERNLSRAPGSQAEVSIAVDPSDPRVLVAGSNDTRGTVVLQRTYTSTNGGATWRSRVVAPPPGAARFCVDPAVAVDSRGLQVHVFACDRSLRRSSIYVVRRASARRGWTRGRLVSRPRAGVIDDKPAVAVDTSPVSRYEGRIYVAWSRVAARTSTILVSRSANGGRTWSRPVRVGRRPGRPSYVSLAVGADGRVFAAWMDFRPRSPVLYVARSNRGGTRFARPRTLVRTARRDARCPVAGTAIPAQPRRCIRPNPVIGVDVAAPPAVARVYVTYGDRGRNRAQDVFVAELSYAMRPRTRRRRVGPRDARPRSDQFWPTSAVDPVTGTLWACYYDTAGARARRTALFTCTTSDDGGRTWTQPQRAASRRSNMTVAGSDPFEYGDYQGVAVLDGVAHPAWTDGRLVRRLGAEVWSAALTAP